MFQTIGIKKKSFFWKGNKLETRCGATIRGDKKQ